MNVPRPPERLHPVRSTRGRRLRPAGRLPMLVALAALLVGCATGRDHGRAEPSEDFAIAVLVLAGREGVPDPWSSSVFAVYPDRTLHAGFIDAGTVPRLEAGTRRTPPYARTLSRSAMTQLWLLTLEACGGADRGGGIRVASLDTHQPIPGVPSAVLEVTALGTRSYHLFLGPLDERLEGSLETDTDTDRRTETGAFERLLVLLRELTWHTDVPPTPAPVED